VKKNELPTTAIKNLIRTGGKIVIAARARHKRGSALHPSRIIHIHRDYYWYWCPPPWWELW